MLALACHVTVTKGPTSDGDAESDKADDDAASGEGDAPGPVVVQPDPEPDAEAPAARGPDLPSGPLCDSDADCGADQVCEGVGCEAGQGRCAPRERMCTRDLATYCGCDGKEFQSSGACANARYAFRGPCEPQLEDGEPCADGRQCKSGQCVGEGLEGCGRNMGVCGTQECTRDAVPYCSCNGTEFNTSGTCPNRQFAYRGSCEAEAG